MEGLAIHEGGTFDTLILAQWPPLTHSGSLSRDLHSYASDSEEPKYSPAPPFLRSKISGESRPHKSRQQLSILAPDLAKPLSFRPTSSTVVSPPWGL